MVRIVGGAVGDELNDGWLAGLERLFYPVKGKVGEIVHLGGVVEAQVVSRGPELLEMGRLRDGQMVKNPSAKVIGNQEQNGVFCLLEKGKRVEVVERGLIADDAENRHLLREAGDRGDIAVDARKPAVAEKAPACFGEKKVIPVADRHPVS